MLRHWYSLVLFSPLQATRQEVLNHRCSGEQGRAIQVAQQVTYYTRAHLQKVPVDFC